MPHGFEKAPIYHDNGRVRDPETARIGAEIEDTYRKKLFGIFKRSEAHIGKGELEAELAMEGALSIDKEDLPDFVNLEFNKYVEAFEKGNDELELEGDLKIDQIKVSDLGNGIKRYRIFCEFSERPSLEDAALTGMNVTRMALLANQYEDLIITIDEKNAVILKSNVDLR